MGIMLFFVGCAGMIISLVAGGVLWYTLRKKGRQLLNALQQEYR